MILRYLLLFVLRLGFVSAQNNSLRAVCGSALVETTCVASLLLKSTQWCYFAFLKTALGYVKIGRLLFPNVSY